MPGTERTDELLTLCTGLVDGGLDEAPAARLRDLLRDDARARDFYLRYMEIHALLHLDYSAGSTPAAMPGGSSMPRSSLTGPDFGVAVFEASGASDPVVDGRPPATFPTGALIAAFAAGMAAMLLALALGWAIVRTGDPRRPSRPAVAAAGRVDDWAGSRSSVARVIRLADARWEPAAVAPPKEGDFVEAGPLRLRSGGVDLAFRGGATLSLEGPADLDLIAANQVFCRRGRLRARVPRGADGFVIASPRSDARDIGADFALDVDPDGRVRIRVLEGLAEAESPGTDPAPAPVGMRGEASGAGEADYPLDLSPNYPDRIREARPIGYWRFTALEGDGFASEVPNAPALRVTGDARPTGDPRGNRYLVLAARPTESFLESDPVWRLPQAPGHAVEFWFRAAAGRHASLVGLLPPPDVNPIGQQDHYLHTLLVELTTSEPQSLHKPRSVRLLLRPPSDPLRVTNVYSARPYGPGRWHHVVAQRRGDSAELYLDGVPTEAPLLNPDPTPAPCRIVVGRRMPDPGDRNESRAFVGGLDELALYDRPLSPEEVRQHWLATVPRPTR